MAGWFSMLRAVPWGHVIDSAPRVVSGTRRFWHAVSGEGVREEIDITEVQSSYTGEHEELSAIRSRLTALEQSAVDLREQILAASELIKTLADQNAQLIVQTEKNRRHTRWLAVALFVSVVAALAVLLFVPYPNADLLAIR